MFKQITNLDGNEIYLIISLFIFIVFFIGVGIRLFYMKKDYAEYMNNIPLEGSDHEPDSQTEPDKSI